VLCAPICLRSAKRQNGEASQKSDQHRPQDDGCRDRQEQQGNTGQRREQALLSTVPALDAQRPGPAYRVLEQLERDRVSYDELVERCPLMQIAAMKENVAITAHADEAVALSHQDFGDASDRGCSTRIARHRAVPAFPRSLGRRTVKILSAHVSRLSFAVRQRQRV